MCLEMFGGASSDSVEIGDARRAGRTDMALFGHLADYRQGPLAPTVEVKVAVVRCVLVLCDFFARTRRDYFYDARGCGPFRLTSS
jgi:hypothetical protein